MDTTSEWPGEIGQSIKAIKPEDSLQAVEPRLINVALVATKGYSILIPEELRESGILTDPNRRNVLNKLLLHQGALNDRIDFSLSTRQDISDIVDELNKEDQKTKDELLDSIGSIDGSDRMKSFIRKGLEEVEYVEQAFRLHKEPSFDEVEKYRNLVNAISNLTVTSVIVGDEHLSSRMQIDKEISNIEDIYDKYSWIINGEYQNRVERAVCISHQMAMAAQVDDDWHGRHIDTQLHVESFSTAALREKKNNTSDAKGLLSGVKEAYLSKARSLGLGFIPAKAFDRLSATAQAFMRFTTLNARYSNNPILKKYSRSFSRALGVREKAFVEGRL